MNATSKITLILMTLAAVVFFSLAGCGNDEKPAPAKAQRDKPLVALFLYRASDTYIASVGTALRARLEPAVELIMYDGQMDRIIQAEQFDAALDLKVDAMIVNVVDPKDAAALVAKARAASTPVIFFNREPDDSVLRSSDQVCFVGTYVQDAGKMQGDIIATLWEKHPEYDRNHDGRLQYVMFQGEPDNPEAIARTEYSVKQARENGVAMQQLGGTFVCNWDSQLAEQAMETAIKNYGPQIELVLSNNDSMALGAIAALNRHGYNLPGKPFIPVIGIDAIEEAVTAIKNNTMSATVRQDNQAMAEVISRLLMNALAHRPFLDGTDYVWDETGEAIRVPYAPYLDED